MRCSDQCYGQNGIVAAAHRAAGLSQGAAVGRQIWRQPPFTRGDGRLNRSDGATFRRTRPKAPRRRGPQPRARAGGGEGRVQRRRRRRPAWRRSPSAPASASARSTAISRPARHLFEAVYRREVEQLGELAEQLEGRGRAGRGVAALAARQRRVRRDQEGHDGGACSSRPTARPNLQAYSFERLTKAVGALLTRAVAAGEIRADISAEDVLRALVGHVLSARSARLADTACCGWSTCSSMACGYAAAKQADADRLSAQRKKLAGQNSADIAARLRATQLR